MELATALAGASAAFEMLKTAVAARDDAKARQAVGNMAMKLSEAYISALASAERENALATRARELQDEVNELKLQAEDRESYAIAEVRPGAYAYARKPVEGEAVRPPYYCQPCKDHGIKSILRLVDGGYTGNSLECAANKRHDITQM